MPPVTTARPEVDRYGGAAQPRAIFVFAVLGMTFALRLAQVSFAMLSPLSYQPGPDEDYYQRFGTAVAAGHGQNGPEFTFMDPAYGYLLGALFKLLGVNLIAVYLLQAVLDTATAYGIYVIGRRLDRPRAGLLGAAVYGLTATAIMFTTTLLKETWVTAYCTWWVAGALALLASDRKRTWLAFGVYCGLGIGLRSTLLLTGCCALALPFLAFGARLRAPGRAVGLAALLALGMAAAVLPWSIRNERAYGSASPLPHNGGIVLHQIYNDQNPRAANWIPGFVDYLHPSEIWRGYAAEASRRLGHELTPPQVDRYWRDQALAYMAAHPAAVIGDVSTKAMKFVSATETPNNRSAAEERMFSPVLQILPAPAPWLIGMGLAGLGWLMMRDRRWLLVAVPIAVAWFTFAFFWAEDRFRFHAMGLLAFCSGYWIDCLAMTLRDRRPLRALAFGAVAGVIAGLAIFLGGRDPPPTVRWDHVVWGYLKMGKLAEAEKVGERVLQEQPDNGPVLEALGVLAARRQDFPQAARQLQAALAIRPRSHVAHYNLARVYLALGDRRQAAAEATKAVDLNPAPDYRELLAQIQRNPPP